MRPSYLMLTSKSVLRSAFYFLSALALGAQASRRMPTPPTPAEQAKWKEEGRTAPAPELLQPTLDLALPAYVSRPASEITGHFKGAASDVLAVLTKKWLAAFQKYYPGVVIDVPPP